MFSGFIHVIGCMSTPSFYGRVILHHMDITAGSLGHFHFLTIRNNAVFVYKFVCGHNFISLGFIPKSGVAGSHSDSILYLLRDCQIILSSLTSNT